MSNFPTIPEFVNNPTEMSTAIRSLKMAVEQIAGIRQGESKGAPQMFVQPTEPNAGKRIGYKEGDLWINTTTNKLNYYTGQGWKELS